MIPSMHNTFTVNLSMEHGTSVFGNAPVGSEMHSRIAHIQFMPADKVLGRKFSM